MLVLGIHGVQVRDRRSRERRIVIPAEEVIPRPRCRLNRDIRIEHGIACDRIRIRRRMACRGFVVQTPLYRIALRRTPLCIEMLVCRIARCETRHRRTRERCVFVPALKVIARARCRSQRNIRIQHGITRNRIRIGSRVTRRASVIQRIRNCIRVGRTPLCVVVLCLRIHGREAGNRGTRESGIVVPSFKGIAVPTCG